MTEQTFVRELERRADRIRSAPLTFDAVRGRARAVRRRRRATAAASVAAAVALVALVPAGLAGRLDRADGPEPAPSPTPPAGVSVLHDGTVTTPDGDRVRVDLDTADVDQLGVLTDGRILAVSSRPQAIRLFAADGSPAATYRVAYGVLRMSADDRLAAWVGRDGRVEVLESGSDQPVPLVEVRNPGVGASPLDAVTGSGCADGGCQALVSDGTATVAETSTTGSREVGDGAFRVTDISPDGRLWAIAFPPTGDQMYPCVGLYDPETEEVVQRSCAAGTLSFAPDGAHLLSVFRENNMAGNIAVLDLALQKVTDVSPLGGTVSQVGWLDATHVVAGVTNWKTQMWSLQRFDLQGGHEVLEGPAKGRNPELVAEYVLSD